MKRCKDCWREKPLEAYYANVQLKDGHEAVCKACRKNKRNSDYSFSKSFEQANKPYEKLKKIAGSQNIPFKLSNKEYWDYLNKSCCFCGETISSICFDLKDITLGYKVDNLFVFCDVCSRHKGTISCADYFLYIKKVSDYLER